MMRPKVFHGTYSMICANSVLPTFIPHSRFVKPGMIANAQYEIQIVDTHESLETLIIVGVAVGTSQFNRTLVQVHTEFYVSRKLKSASSPTLGIDDKTSATERRFGRCRT